MKPYLFIILMSGFLTGCSQKETQPLLIGSWLWEGSSGGFGGAIIKPKPNERVVLEFSDNGQFSLRKNDTLVLGGTFQLTKERSIYSGKEAPKIEVSDVKNSGQVKSLPPVSIRGVITTLSISQLSIGDNAYDGYGSSFVRN